MGRMSVLARHPWRALGGLTALLVAGAAAVGSGALFTTQTVNPTNTFTTGILKIGSSSDEAILQAEGLVPGDVKSGTVTISNTGTVDGSNWTLTQDQTAETPGTDPQDPTKHGALSGKLTLKVEDTTTGSAVYDGPISGLDTASLATIAQGDGNAHTFRFTVTYPGGGSDDNSYEGGSLTESYAWTASAGS